MVMIRASVERSIPVIYAGMDNIKQIGLIIILFQNTALSVDMIWINILYVNLYPVGLS